MLLGKCEKLSLYTLDPLLNAEFDVVSDSGIRSIWNQLEQDKGGHRLDGFDDLQVFVFRRSGQDFDVQIHCQVALQGNGNDDSQLGRLEVSHVTLAVDEDALGQDDDGVDPLELHFDVQFDLIRLDQFDLCGWRHGFRGMRSLSQDFVVHQLRFQVLLADEQLAHGIVVHLTVPAAMRHFQLAGRVDPH